MKAAVIVFPGSNREQDVARALKKATSHEPAILWHAERDLPNGTDLVVLPGGFSYGDYLRCGAIAARSPILEAVRDHAARGGLILGICNGFQILCEAGLLPGVLMRNAGMRFICKMQYLRVENAGTRFTRGYAPGQVVKFVIAHGEGNFRAPTRNDPGDRRQWTGRLPLLRCERWGRRRSNPNGSENGIAGVFNERFNVLGLMPHPENVIDALVGGVDGRALFEAVAA